MNKKSVLLVGILLWFAMAPNVYAMHISEGFLPQAWSALYFILSAPFFIMGIRTIRKMSLKNKDIKMLIAVVGAYAFILSSMKIPSVSGSCSHPTGTGLSAILFGPFVSAVIGSIVLLFQAILLAHGGITTLGANLFSMGIAGPIVSWVLYKLIKKKNKRVAVFCAACFGDLTTYLVTSLQLSLAFRGNNLLMAFLKFFGIFSITQIPLAIVEGILTVIIFEFIEKYSKEEIKALSGEI